MTGGNKKTVAIVDYGLGNLFSIKQACEYVGLNAIITNEKKEILTADAVVLPGVGAFGNAMSSLEKLDIVSLLTDIALSGTFFMGICLGMQLLMKESYEFGHHKGLGIVDGTVVHFENKISEGRSLKVPQVGWNRIFSPFEEKGCSQNVEQWNGTPLAGFSQGEFMYFVHSYYVQPEKDDVSLTVTHYGDTKFCSSLMVGNIFACQFHPERSGVQGLNVYRNIASHIGSGLVLEEEKDG
jgi:imidazole glycerol-phosphate synthase subunit HisH